MDRVYGVKNTILECLVTDGSRLPLVFSSEEEACRWFRLNGYPKSLIMINTKEGATAKERKELIKAWVIKNGSR